MNLPNTLSALRIALVPVFVALVLADEAAWALLVFVVAGTTDGIDGYLARKLDQRTALGAHLDPLADKLLTLAAFVLLVLRGVLPPWLLALALTRDVGILLGHALSTRVARVREVVEPSVLGKLNTVVSLVTLGVALALAAAATTPWAGPLQRGLGVLVWVLAVSLVTSGVHYAVREIALLRAVRRLRGRNDLA